MALEAVVYPKTHFVYSNKEFYNTSGGWSFYEYGGLGLEEEERGSVLENGVSAEGGDYVNFNLSCSPSMLQNIDDCNMKSTPLMETSGDAFRAMEAEATREKGTRRKRRRTKSYKNKEEEESQRLTHIMVERNRRKQMNEYLAVLRSLMPASYAQRGDQASIVGGAINFVKELEQLLQTLEAEKHIKKKSHSSLRSPPFASFITFPQYSSNNTKEVAVDIEVTMIESHVNLKIRVRQQPKQLLRILMGLQSLWLTALHLNVTTAADQMALYSFSLKVEDDCQFTSVDEIAAAVHQMVVRIQNESVQSSSVECDDILSVVKA